jgi:hypothetical protein
LKAKVVLIAACTLVAGAPALCTESDQSDPDPQAFQEWQRQLKDIPTPPHAASGACYVAEYPVVEYREVPCAAPSASGPFSRPPEKLIKGKPQKRKSAQEENFSPGGESAAISTNYLMHLSGDKGNFNHARGYFQEFSGKLKRPYSLQLNSNS